MNYKIKTKKEYKGSIYDDIQCSTCSGKRFIIDHHSADFICCGCGLVISRIVDDSATRVYASDSLEKQQSKIQEASFDSKLYSSIPSLNKRLDPRTEFLRVGYASIEDSMNNLFPGTNFASIKYQAKYYLRQAYDLQMKEMKEGITKKPTRRKKVNGKHPIPMKKIIQYRKNITRRKTFIVSVLRAALYKENIDDCFISDINKTVRGVDISKASCKRCWKELDLNIPILNEDI